MIRLNTLVVGSLFRAKDGSVLEAHSTSTLIRTDDRFIIVDTSTRKFKPELKTSLKCIGIRASDVDTIVLTHSHHDHVENIDMFPNAKIMIHAGDNDFFREAEIIEKDTLIAKGVELRYTPGHSWDSMSVFVDGYNGKYVIAGDAIPLEDNFKKNIPPMIHVCKDAAVKSIKTISNYANVIVPGHGAPFKTKG